MSKIDKKLMEWDDEECLNQFSKFLDRVGISSQFIQNDEGLLTHQLMLITCGEKVIVSEPLALEWPLQPLPMPEAFEGKIN